MCKNDNYLWRWNIGKNCQIFIYEFSVWSFDHLDKILLDKMCVHNNIDVYSDSVG